MTSIGEHILNLVIRQGMVTVKGCPAEHEAHVLVWCANSAEQIGAAIDEWAAAGIRKVLDEAAALVEDVQCMEKGSGHYGSPCDSYSAGHKAAQLIRSLKWFA